MLQHIEASFEIVEPGDLQTHLAGLPALIQLAGLNAEFANDTLVDWTEINSGAKISITDGIAGDIAPGVVHDGILFGTLYVHSGEQHDVMKSLLDSDGKFYPNRFYPFRMTIGDAYSILPRFAMTDVVIDTQSSDESNEDIREATKARHELTKAIESGLIISPRNAFIRAIDIARQKSTTEQ